jgi:hypothetical protein
VQDALFGKAQQLPPDFAIVFRMLAERTLKTEVGMNRFESSLENIV